MYIHEALKKFKIAPQCQHFCSLKVPLGEYEWFSYLNLIAVNNNVAIIFYSKNEQGRCMVVDSVDDKDDYQTVTSALETCDFKADEIKVFVLY